MKAQLLFLALAMAFQSALASTPAPTPAATQVVTGDEWSKAVKAVQAGKFSDAIAPLDAMSRKFWTTPAGEKATALLVECYLQTKSAKKAQWVAKRFLDSKPSSIYRDRIETALAFLKTQEGNVFGGLEDLVRINTYSKNPAIKARTKEAMLQILAASLLRSEELQSIAELNADDHDIQAYLYLQLGREYQIEGRWKAARYHYSRVIQVSPSTPVADAAKQGISALENQGNGTPSILVLAPLTGDFAEFGGRMIQGAVLAHEEFTARNGKKLILRIVDDHADPVRATHRVQEILAQEEVAGIIGPMMSPAATAIGAWLAKAYPEIPMITPTATDEGIASLGANVFQLNVPTASLARSIAEYALRCLNARDFAIFSPLSDYGRIMSDEFTRTVEAGGGQVFAMQQYQEGAPDFQTEFNRVRSRKLNFDNRRRNIAKGFEATDTWAPKERKEYMEDSLISFDAIFIPAADPADAAAMASHTAFNKLGGKLLGSSGWYGRALVADGKRIVENSYFSVPFTESGDNADFQKFAKAFAARWENQQPDKERVSGLSYDATRIFLDTWLKTQGKNVPLAILQQKNFAGVYGSYAFDATGANSAQHILTVQKSKFALSDACPVLTEKK